MEKKLCPRCNVEKTFENFPKNKNRKFGLDSWCKECKRKKDNEYSETCERKNNKKEWYENNKDKVLKDGYKWKKNNKSYKEKTIKYNKLKRAKEKGFKTIEEYENYLLNKKIEIKLKKEAIEKEKFEKKKQREIIRKYKIDNADRLKKERRIKNNEKRKEQRKVDVQFQIMDTLRCRTRKILKIQSARKTTNMAKLIGCSGKELAERFLAMGYNPNTCHIDHIIPISLFDLTIPEHQHIVCHYLNLQPLNAIDNLIKHDSLVDEWREKIKEICNVINIDYNSVIKHIESRI